MFHAIVALLPKRKYHFGLIAKRHFHHRHHHHRHASLSPPTSAILSRSLLLPFVSVIVLVSPHACGIQFNSPGHGNDGDEQDDANVDDCDSHLVRLGQNRF